MIAGWLQLIELSCRKFETPDGASHADLPAVAHRMGVERDDSDMQDVHLADALREIVRKTRKSLSDTACAMISIEQSFHKIAGC